MNAHAVTLTETDRLQSFVRSFPTPRTDSEVEPLRLKNLGPDDAAGEGMIGRSAALLHVVEQIRMVASTDSTVLICEPLGAVRAAWRGGAARHQPEHAAVSNEEARDHASARVG